MPREFRTSRDDLDSALFNDITQQRIFNLFREFVPLSKISLWEVKESILSGIIIVVLDYRCVAEDGSRVKISLIVDAREDGGADLFTITHVAGPIPGSGCLIYAVSGELTARDDEANKQERESS